MIEVLQTTDIPAIQSPLQCNMDCNGKTVHNITSLAMGETPIASLAEVGDLNGGNTFQFGGKLQLAGIPDTDPQGPFLAYRSNGLVVISGKFNPVADGAYANITGLTIIGGVVTSITGDFTPA